MRPASPPLLLTFPCRVWTLDFWAKVVRPVCLSPAFFLLPAQNSYFPFYSNSLGRRTGTRPLGWAGVLIGLVASICLGWVGDGGGLSAAAAQGVVDKTVDQLIEQLGDPEVNARRDAAYELVRRGERSAGVIEAYARATQDKDIQVQFQSLYGLALAGPAAESALPTLLERMDDRNDQIRFRAADAVGKIGVGAVPALLERWPQGSTRFRISASQAWEIMGPTAEPALPVLLALVQETGTRRPSDDGQAAEPRGRGRNRQRGDGQRAEGPDAGAAPYAAAAAVAIDPTRVESLLSIADHWHVGTRMIGISALAALPSPDQSVLERLRASTRDADPKIREISVVVLAKSMIPAVDKEALLEAALVDSAPSVRAAANVALRRARLNGPAFAQRLAGRLQEVERDRAVSLLQGLAAFGPAARGGLPQIVAATERLGLAPLDNPTGLGGTPEESEGQEQDAAAEEASAAAEDEAGKANDAAHNGTAPDGLPQEAVVGVLAGLGPAAVGELLEMVQQHASLEPVVAAALTRIGSAAIEPLLAGTSHETPAIRIVSVRALGDMQPLAAASLQRLIEVIGDENLAVRTAAAAALTRAAASNSAAQEAVLQAMQDPSPTVRAVAVSALGEAGFNREQRRDGFRRALSDPDAQVRAAALTAIAQVPGQLQRNAEVILQQTADGTPAVRLAAFSALANAPKESLDNGQFAAVEDVRAAVQRGLQDGEVTVRIAATAVIPKLELYDQVTLDVVGKNLSGGRELIVATLEVLPKFTGDTNAIVAQLQPLLGHELSEVRIAAVTAIAAADREPLRLTQALVPMLEDREWVVRRIAGQNLGRQGSVAVSAVPKLFELLGRHEDKDYAAESLRQIDAAPVEALPLLIDNVDSEDRRKAFYAVTLLGKLGPAAAEALPKLEAILQADSQGGAALDDFRRNTIKEAIAKIKPAA